MIELSEYIRLALSEIVKGVNSAREELHEDVALCAHTDKAYSDFPSVTYKAGMKEKQAPVTVVGFRVQVITSEEQNKDKGISASVLKVISGGVSGASSSSTALTQEITFSVPMVWKISR